MQNDLLTLRRAASQFLEDFEGEVIDALPAFARKAWHLEYDAIEGAQNNAAITTKAAGASDDEVFYAGCDASGAIEAASPIVSLIREHGRTCRAAILEMDCGADAEALMWRAAVETANAVIARLGGGGVVARRRLVKRADS